MKNRLIITLLVFVLIFTLAACNGNENPAGDNIPKYDAVALANWQDYTIVYPDSADSAETLAFEQFRQALVDKYGANSRVESDFLIPGEEAPVGTLEILIGETNRPETATAIEGLKANDYTIRFINNRLVIVGGSASATYEAVSFAINYLLADSGVTYPAGDSFVVKSEYKLDTLTVGGVDISEFQIVRGKGMNATDRLMLDSLQVAIGDACGVKVEIVAEKSDEATYEILIGDTGRAETSVELAEGFYSINQTENKIAMYGNGNGAAAYLIREFIEVIKAIEPGKSYDINLTSVTEQPFTAPSLAEVNLPEGIPSFAGKYDADFDNYENVLERFYMSVNELPEEVTVLPAYDIDALAAELKNQVYVAPDGNDKNPGTIDQPLATVNAALKKIRPGAGGVVWVRGGTYELDSTISLVPANSGNLLNPTIISAYKDEVPVFTTVKSINPADFSGVDYANDALASRIPAEAQPHIAHVNLFELGWTKNDLGSISTSGTPSLFIDGEYQYVARYPNADQELLYITTVYDTGSVTSRDGSWIYQWWMPRVQNWQKWKDANGGSYDWNVTYYHQSKGQTLKLYASEADAIADAKALQASVDAGNAPYKDNQGNQNISHGWTIGMIDLTPCMWENTGDIWYYGNVFEGWEYGYYNIKEFNIAKRTMTSKTGSVYGAAVSGNSPTGHNDYYLFNAIEALDAPGEWFMNFETGDLYIYGTENFENAKITYASTNKINGISASDAEFVIINGLTVDETSGHGIYLYNSNDIVVQNCTVKNTGTAGIYLSSSENCAVIYNDVSQTGNSMISLTHSAAAYALEPDKNIVQNNYCHDPKVSKSGGISAGGCRSVISHNFLEDVRISFSTSVECIIEYNEIRSGGKYESDAGMIYLNGFYHIGNHIRYNYLYDWGTPGNGVYFDDLSSFNYAYYNIMDSSEKVHEKATGFCYTSTGHYNVFYGNIFIGRSVDRINESAIYFNDKSWLGYRWSGLSQNFVNTYTSKYDQSALFARFPELEVYLSKMALHVEERAMQGYVRNELEVYLRSPADNIVKNNVVIGTSVCFNQPARVENGVTLPSFDYVGENFHSKVSDGIFVDYLNGDFTIYEDVLEMIKTVIPDFQPLTTEKAGLTD